MEQSKVLLSNGVLEATILLPNAGYNRSRYDWGGMVEQVCLNGHLFLSREQDMSGGVGLGGIGLVNVFEWRTTELYDKTAITDYFPMPGVGLLKRPDTAPFLFTRDYYVVPFERRVETNDKGVCIRTLPHLCCGAAIDMRKTFSVDGYTLSITIEAKNVGSETIHATEFCHNFFRFDDAPIDCAYRLSFPYTIEPKLRRGELIVERDAYRLGRFDKATESSAFWIRGWEGMQSHWMKLTHEGLGMSVLIEDEVPICNFYSWNNVKAFCPEVFAPIELAPGEAVRYSRRYTFEA